MKHNMTSSKKKGILRWMSEYKRELMGVCSLLSAILGNVVKPQFV